MRDILLLFLMLFCFISFSKEKKLLANNTIDTKEKQKKFMDIENKIFFNNTSLEKVYVLNINEKKNIAISNPTKYIFVLKNLTINSEINLLIGPNGNNIQFDNIIINDEKLSNVNVSNINKIYYKIQNETIRVEIRANLKDKEKKNNSFYISLLHIRKKTKDKLYFSALIIGIFSGFFNMFSAIFVCGYYGGEKLKNICSYTFPCCCGTRNKKKEKRKIYK